MKDNRIRKTRRGNYVAVEWSGENESGLKPVGDRVLVLPDQAAAKIGNIYMPDEETERQGYAAESGVLVAVGDGAFEWNSDRTRPWSGEKPQVGARVHFGRYSGQEYVGEDDLKYMIMSDHCIGAVEI